MLPPSLCSMVTSQGGLSPGKPSLTPPPPLPKRCSHHRNGSVKLLASAARGRARSTLQLSKHHPHRDPTQPLLLSGAPARLSPQGWHCPPVLFHLACRDANFHILKFKRQTPHLDDARQSAGKETGPSPFSAFPSAPPHLLTHECQISLNLMPSISTGFGLLLSLYLHRLKPAIALSPSSTQLPKNYLIYVAVLPFLLHSFTTH